MTDHRLLRTLLAGTAACVAFATAATAQTRTFNVPAGDLKAALDLFGAQSGIQLIFRPGDVRGARSPGVSGSMPADEALGRLLAGTGFRIERDPSGAIAIMRGAAPPGEGEAAGAAADSEGAGRDDSRILVVGSRLGVRSPVESALPIRVITREEIDRSGASTIAQALSYLPEVSINNVGDTNIGGGSGVGGGDAIDATTVQLRGLPAGTTLILINGRRSGESSNFMTSGQFDLSTIPLAMVERIEVLPAGASAIYGGDALAGVVNIVLRRDANGFELRGRSSMTEGHAETEANILWGRSWSGARITVGINWRRTGKLTNFERNLTADQNFTRFGGRDLRSTSLGYPANIYSLAGCPPAPDLCFVPLAQRGNLPGLNSPFASVPAGQDGQNLTPSDFVATAGTLNRAPSFFNIFSPSESWGANFSGSLDVTPNLELFAEFAYNRRDIPALPIAIALFGGDFNIPAARIPANNPYNPFGVDVGVSVRFNDTGIFLDFDQTYWRALLGARGRIGRWNWELAASQSRDRSGAPSGNFVSQDAIIAALQSTDPATAINAFVGDGSPPWSEQTLQSLRIPVTSIPVVSQLRDVTGFARGPLLRLPGGDILLLVGGEYQQQSVTNPPLEGAGSASQAVFAEVRAPILRHEGDSYDRLTLTGAWRREWSSRFEGSANTQTVGIEFRPWQTLLLRGTYSTAFKPVTLFTALAPTNTAEIFLPDPRFGGQIFPLSIAFDGGVPEGLVPETGTSRTFGAVWSPSANLRASVTWFDNRLRNRFVRPDPNFLIENENLYPGRVIRDPGSGLLVSVDARTINVARIDVSGIDVAVDTRWSTPVGDFIPSLAATYMIEHEEQQLPTLPVQDNLGIRRSTGWSPRWKIVPRLGWDYRNIVYANLAGRYVSAYRDTTPLNTGPNAGQLLRLGDFWLVDLNVDINVGRWLFRDSRLLAGSRLSVGVNNLFDRLPDFCNGCGTSGYDATQYDIVGRRIHLAARFSF